MSMYFGWYPFKESPFFTPLVPGILIPLSHRRTEYDFVPIHYISLNVSVYQDLTLGLRWRLLNTLEPV